MTIFYVWLVIAVVVLTALAYACERAPYDPYADRSQLDVWDEQGGPR